MAWDVKGWLRRARWPRRIAIALIAFELLYLVAANVALNSAWGRGVVNSQAPLLTASWSSAWTILPGLVHVEGLEAAGESRRVAWRGSADRGHGWVWPPSLLGRHLRILSGAASGIEGELDLLPEPDTPPGDPGWAATLQNVQVEEVRRLRLGGYQLAGRGRVAGRVRAQVEGPLALRLRSLAFDDGVAHADGEEVARRLVIRSRLTTEPFLLGEQSLLDLLEGVSGRLDLTGEVEHVGFLGAYLRGVSWLHFDGSGELALDLTAEEGSLQPGSTLALDSPAVEAAFFDFTARGRGRIEGGVSAEEEGIRIGGLLSELTVERNSDGATILTGEDAELHAVVPLTHMHLTPEELVGEVRLERGRIDDLTKLAVYLPPGLDVRIDSGSAEMEAELRYDTAAGSGQGWLKLSSPQVTGGFGDSAFATALEIDAELPDLDLLAGRFDIAGSYLTAESTLFAQGDRLKTADWWGKVRIPAGHVLVPPPAEWAGQGGPVEHRPVAIVADLEAELRDNAPVVILLEQRLPRLHWIDRLMTIPEVALTGTARAEGRALGLHALHVTGGGDHPFELRAELDLVDKAPDGVAYVHHRHLAAAISLHHGHRSWKLVHARRHYEEAVAEYLAQR